MLEVEDPEGGIIEVYIDGLGRYTIAERIGEQLRVPKFRSLDELLDVLKIIVDELGGETGEVEERGGA